MAEPKMKALNTEARLGYARAAVAVLRALKIADVKLSYRQFVTAIGLMAEDEEWQVWHRQEVTDILNLVGATARQAGSREIESIQFEQVVRAADGEPGAGFYKTARIVTE
jgi:hypothetical protein